MNRHENLERQANFREKAETPSLKFLKPPGERLTESKKMLNTLIEELEQEDYSDFEVLELDYSKYPIERLDKQVSASLVLIQPEMTSIRNGELLRGSYLLLAKRQSDRWEGEKWSVPMGKIEIDKDAWGELRNETAQTIIEGAHRERLEEIIMTPTQSDSTVADSFRDNTTGMTVHVVVNNIIHSSEGQPIVLRLPDEREHSEVAWYPIEKLSEIEEDSMGKGTKLAILTALRKILVFNNEMTTRKSQKH